MNKVRNKLGSLKEAHESVMSNLKFRHDEVMKNWIKADTKHPPEHLKDCCYVKCIAEIKKVSTGEVVEYETDERLDFGEQEPCVFNWEENNYSCDCNRNLFFKRAKGEEITDEDWNAPCPRAEENEYLVNLKNKLDSKIYYQEFEHENI